MLVLLNQMFLQSSRDNNRDKAQWVAKVGFADPPGSHRRLRYAGYAEFALSKILRSLHV
jgi:hypothetical protein